MEYFFLIIGVCICLGLLILAYIYFKEGKQRQMDALATAAIYREERRAAGFWNGVERRTPVREFALTSDEKAAASLRMSEVSTGTQGVTDSVNRLLAARSELDELTAIADALIAGEEVAPIPKYDYPNVDGFPFDGVAYHQFKDEMLKHGFIMRFVMPTKEIQVIYENPNDLSAQVMRKLYTAPSTIYPANLLHDQGCILTALWAMRKFKSEERLSELDGFIYL